MTTPRRPERAGTTAPWSVRTPGWETSAPAADVTPAERLGWSWIHGGDAGVGDRNPAEPVSPLRPLAGAVAALRMLGHPGEREATIARLREAHADAVSSALLSADETTAERRRGARDLGPLLRRHEWLLDRTRAALAVLRDAGWELDFRTGRVEDRSAGARPRTFFRELVDRLVEGHGGRFRRTAEAPLELRDLVRRDLETLCELTPVREERLYEAIQDAWTRRVEIR